MKKVLKWMGYSYCFLLLCLFVYRAIPSTLTAGNTVHWLKESGLIDQNTDFRIEINVFFKPVIKIVMEDEDIEVMEYLYNREKYAKKMENAPGPAIYSPYAFVYNKNVEVRINKEKDEPDDFEKVVKAQKPLLSLKDVFSSRNVQQSVREFNKRDNFTHFMKVFNEIETEEIARKTYKHYFHQKEVTWSGVLIDKEFDQHLTLYGDPENYKGESISYIRGDFRHYQPLSEKMPYVMFVTLSKKEDLSAIKKGDLVTIQGNVSRYTYQPTSNPVGWEVDDSSILVVQKTNVENYLLDKDDVYEWVKRSFSFSPSDLFQEKKKNETLSHFQSFDKRTHVTVYPTIQLEKPIHPANEGYEFTYKNVTVWTSREKETLEPFQDILEEEKPIKR